MNFNRCNPLEMSETTMKTTVKTRTKRARRESLNLRIPAAERGLIDRAAKSSRQTQTDFILGAARRAVEEELLERTVFVVSPAAYPKFIALLDAPRRTHKRLRRTMRTAPPWPKG